MHWLVDIEARVADGILTRGQGDTLRARARADAAALAVNILLVGGILAVMAGMVALVPTPAGLAASGAAVAAAGLAGLLAGGDRLRLPANAAAVVGIACAGAGGLALAAEAVGGPAPAIWGGLAALGLGLALRARGPTTLRVAAAWTAVLGAAAHIAGLAALETETARPWVLSLDATALCLLLGLALDIRLATALAVVALAGTLASTGYGHATYFLAIHEPTLAILLLGAAAGVGLWASVGLSERWARHGRIGALMALVWINLAFWIGSLWGDRPGSRLLGPSPGAFESPGAYAEARQAWEARVPEIPDWAFALGWAALILGVAAWAGATGRRSALNAAVAFGAIHFYTQWFERLEAAPATIVAAGVVAIALAWGMVRLNASAR